jgi:hypothetical protein
MSKVWLITGSSRGLGRALAEAVLAAGHRLVATARNPAQLADLVERYRDRIRAVALNVTDDQVGKRRGASSLLCKWPSFGACIPGRLNGPERRVGLCGDATRAPTQGPGFRECERSSPLGPGILARKR